jgi:hypothetical protein
MEGAMDYEQARAFAIDAGALEPQGMGERMAAGVNAYDGGHWAATPRAQARLEAWTEAILNGVSPSELRRQIG